MYFNIGTSYLNDGMGFSYSSIFSVQTLLYTKQIECNN